MARSGPPGRSAGDRRGAASPWTAAAGHAILDLPSKAAAIEWAIRFGDVVKVNEIEVRQMPAW